MAITRNGMPRIQGPTSSGRPPCALKQTPSKISSGLTGSRRSARRPLPEEPLRRPLPTVRLLPSKLAGRERAQGRPRLVEPSVSPSRFSRPFPIGPSSRLRSASRGLRTPVGVRPERAPREPLNLRARQTLRLSEGPFTAPAGVLPP